jgi:hypothetical protein
MTTLARLTAGLVLWLTWTACGLAQSEPRVALVIGNGAYVNAGELKNPPNDAKAMADMLRKAGFEVIERENTTRRAMIEATRAWAEKLSPGGIGLFFYAGHGVQARGANYLLPTDVVLAVEDDLRYEAIDVQDILNKLDDARVRLSLIILDACRDNPFAKSFRSTSRGLSQIDAPRGTIVAYATAPGKLAADGDGDNGVYTSELLKAMKEPGRKIQDIFEQVTDAVEHRTGNAQTPWISSSFRGDFTFFGSPRQDGPPPASKDAEKQPSAVSPEIVFWQSIANSRDPADFEAYLKQFPSGTFVSLARVRLASLGTANPSTTPPGGPTAAAPHDAADRRAVQTALTKLGHYHAPINVADTPDTRAAIRSWQAFEGLEETGRLPPEQRARLLKQADQLDAALKVGPTSPRGTAADGTKGAKERFTLGSAFERGAGQPKDPAEAAFWYALAAGDHWPAAFTNLGTLYVRGTGVHGPDTEMARRLWLTAAALGDETALFNLGALAESGIGGPADKDLARRWYGRGAARNDAPSVAALKRLGG